jgi:hypothetical protein
VGLVLDVALMAMPVVFAALGVGRGIQREAMTLIGILLGALLAEMWAPLWAEANAARFNQDKVGTQALLAMGLLLGSAIFVGYGGALLLPSRRELAQGRSRLFGGLAGAVNGTLLLGFVLRYGNLRAGPGETLPLLAGTRLGPLLTARMPNILLIGAAGGVAIVVVRLIQRLLFKLHAKPEAKPAARPAAKPAGQAAPAAKAATTQKVVAPAPRPPAPDSTSNPILRDLLLDEHKKKSS